jgi:RNA polymerase sigma-32 factor
MNTPAHASIVRDDPCLSRFLGEIWRFPILTPDEEYRLAKSWREHGDLKAAHRLVNCHLRLVAKIAKGYRGYGLPVSEVISEGSIGLTQAIKRFEPEKGFRFATYAVWWIKAAIQEHILRSWSLVKMGTSANQKKLFFRLRTAKARISALGEGDLRPDQVRVIATELAVTEQDVIDMNRRLAGDVSLNASVRVEHGAGELQDWLVDETVSQEGLMADSEEADWRHRLLMHALTALNERERRVFERRRLADTSTTLDELADQLGISSERVRQIEMRAFEKVQKIVKVLDDRGRRSSDVPETEFAGVSSQLPLGRLGMSKSLGRLNLRPPKGLTTIREAEPRRMESARGGLVLWRRVPIRDPAANSLRN